MVGALSARYRRRRYADGGDVQDMPVPPMPPPDPQDLTSDNGQETPAEAMGGQRAGALSQGQPPPSPVAAIDRGTANLAAKVKQQQDSMNILTAGGQEPSPLFQQAALAPLAPLAPPTRMHADDAPGAVNLPLLAAAGAFLKPTTSGTFSEALGNAFAAATPVVEKQRALNQQQDTWGSRLDLQGQGLALKKAIADRVAELKARGQDDAAAWHQAQEEGRTGVLDERVRHNQAVEGNAATRTATYGDDVNSKIGLRDAQQALAEARTKAAGNGKGATPASIMQAGIESMMQKVNPATGANYTQDEAILMLKGITQRTNLGQQNIELRTQAEVRRWQEVQNTQEYHQGQLQIAALRIDQETKNRIAAGARAQVNLGVPYAKALQTAMANEGILTSGVTPTKPPVVTQGGGTQQAPLPMPGSAAGAIDGKVYLTPKGPATWNAKEGKFYPVSQ